MEIKKKKEEMELIEKNKNTNWTFLINLIMEKLNDEDTYLDLFSDLA